MTDALTGTWAFPTRIWFGPGRIRELPKALAGLAATRPLFVCDSGLRNLPIVTDTLALLEDAGVDVRVFSEVKGNPIGANVEAGIAAFREGDRDSVIAFGGGSALDAAKVIALAARQKLSFWEFEEKPGNWRKADADAIAPVIAVPTTAGTGSEVGRSGVLVNEATNTKVIIFHPDILPKTVISDPELTVGLPPHITAATGMDAFVHCFEALCATGFHPMAEGIALEGMRLIERALPAACRDGSDIEARARMLAAASMGAVAFQKGLGGVHAVAHAVGGIYDTHHGLTNAVLLPYVMAHNEIAIHDKMLVLARVLGLPRVDFAGVLDWVLAMRDQLGIPDRLSELGVDTARADEIGAIAEKDNCALGNPIPVDAATLSKIFVNAVEGRL